MCLLIWEAELQRDEWERDNCLCWFAPHMSTTSRVDPTETRSLEFHLDLPRGWRKPCSCVTFCCIPDLVAGSCIRWNHIWAHVGCLCHQQLLTLLPYKAGPGTGAFPKLLWITPADQLCNSRFDCFTTTPLSFCFLLYTIRKIMLTFLSSLGPVPQDTSSGCLLFHLQHCFHFRSPSSPLGQLDHPQICFSVHVPRCLSSTLSLLPHHAEPGRG